LKKEGEKKKAKTTMKWHNMKCEGSEEKKKNPMRKCMYTISTR